MRTKLLIRNFVLVIVVSAGCRALAQTDAQSIEQKAVSILVEGAANKEPDTRLQAVVAASLVGPHDKVVEFLAGKLSDDDVPVRLAAVASLLDLRDDRAVAPLEKALENQAPEVAFAAAKALFAMKQPVGRDALLSIVSGESKTSSSFMTSKKRGILRQLKTPKSTMTFAFRSGTGYIPVPGLGAGVGAAQALISDGEFTGRASALLLLGTEQDEQIDALIREGLKDENWSMRAAAIQVIAFSNRKGFMEELVSLFEDKKIKVRFRAAAVYVRLRLAERL